MNLTSISGLALAGWVLWAGVFSSTKTPELFLDSHALILVLGGTAAAGLIAFPAKKFFGLINLFLWGLLFKSRHRRSRLASEIIHASATTLGEQRFLTSAPASHPFLREGFSLIAEGALNYEQLEHVLKKRAKHYRHTYGADAKMLNAVAKFPPAFGLLGASTGMIAMMTNLGKGGQDSIGPAMAIALVATFWGIALANLIILPLGDYAKQLSEEDYEIRNLIIDGLLLIKAGQSPKMIEETLNSYLSPGDRIKIRLAPQGNNAEEPSKTQMRRTGS